MRTKPLLLLFQMERPYTAFYGSFSCNKLSDLFYDLYFLVLHELHSIQLV